jgi:hypothetical protein
MTRMIQPRAKKSGLSWSRDDRQEPLDGLEADTPAKCHRMEARLQLMFNGLGYIDDCE